MTADSTTLARPNPHVLIFDHPRACSNLLGKLLDSHPCIRRLHRPWFDCRTRGPDKPSLALTPETVERFQRIDEAAQATASRKDFGNETIPVVNGRVAQFIAASATEGRVPIVQDHTAVILTAPWLLSTLREAPCPWQRHLGNPTILPLSLLQHSVPIFLIRHPALAVPSFARMHTLVVDMLRPQDEMFRYWISMEWQRILYEYTSSLTKDPEWDIRQPLIVDAWDLVHNTSSVLERLCEALAIEKGQIRQSWDAEPILKQNDLDIAWVETLQNSQGVIRDEGVPDEEIRVDDQVAQWNEQFGVEQAKLIRNLVEGEMANYEYLWERRMKF